MPIDPLIKDGFAQSADVRHAIKKLQLLLNKSNRTLIGLTGGPGSGKSTLAEYLVSQVNINCPILSCVFPWMASI